MAGDAGLVWVTGLTRAELEADPFGPWEYVEPDDRCRGHGDGCSWSRCTGRESTCKCCCPVCLGETPEDYGYDGDY